MGSTAAYYASEYQQQYAGAGGAPAAAPAVGGPAAYGHAAYGQSDYTYQAPAEEYQAPPAAASALGSGLLGGMAIGTSPVAAVAPPPYHAYQQQL